MKQIITQQELDAFEKDYEKNPQYDLLSLGIKQNGISLSCLDEDVVNSLPFVFSIDLDSGDVTNQRQSGRCWMFSGLNVLRTMLFDKLKVKNIELSQSYLQFYDKLEKANYYLDQAIKHADEEIRSRDNIFILDSLSGDGGHFVMFTNLVKKYGLCPSSFMPDYSVSKATGELNRLLNDHLCQGIKEIRDAAKKGKTEAQLFALKEKYLNETYRILCMCLGKPVKEFALEYKDKDNVYHKLDKMTPKQFFDTYIGKDLDEYIPLCDGPIQGREKYVKYTCNLVNNVEGESDIVFFNVDRKEMKKAVINSLKDKEPVWFAADVSSQSLRKRGILADSVLKTKELFSLSDKMDKSARMTYRTSFCNHAMTFTGVNLTNNGTPDRWKVENSWGSDNGNKGYFVMSDKWFNEYVNQVFVNKKYVSEKVVKLFEEAKSEEVDPYDTMWMEME